MKVYKEISIDIEAELARLPKAYTEEEQTHLREFYRLFSACKFKEAKRHSNKYQLNEYILNECFDILWNDCFGEVYYAAPSILR